MPPKSNLQVQADALFQALKNAPLEEHWNVMKSANTDAPTLMMPSDGVVKAEDLIKHPNYTKLCPAINTSPKFPSQVPVLLQYHVDPEQEQLPEQEQPDEPYDAAWDEQLYDELYDADWDEQLYAIHCHPPYSDFQGEDYAGVFCPDN